MMLGGQSRLAEQTCRAAEQCNAERSDGVDVEALSVDCCLDIYGTDNHSTICPVIGCAWLRAPTSVLLCTQG